MYAPPALPLLTAEMNPIQLIVRYFSPCWTRYSSRMEVAPFLRAGTPEFVKIVYKGVRFEKTGISSLSYQVFRRSALRSFTSKLFSLTYTFSAARLKRNHAHLASQWTSLMSRSSFPRSLPIS
ncbi:hypothetical protein AVEN_2074-1 [Araneus ventricosus]|uniref:Uncharacterized protein n=1 Tax=Araneus ventricosus TaxID=182803 RepID=A0A4Y2U2J6_ARAVE|nr:hypothetical protein AVEN_2074-1 [Araneus ventricosus]